MSINLNIQCNVLLCKVKKQYLLTCNVSMDWFLALHCSTCIVVQYQMIFKLMNGEKNVQFSIRALNPFSVGIVFILQNLTYRDSPSTEKIKTFLTAVDPRCSNEWKELTKTFMMISNLK